MAYTDEATVEAFLNRALNANELIILPLAIAAVEAYINNQIGSSYATDAAATRYYDGGTQYLQIDAIRGDIAVKIVDSNGDVTSTYDPDEYVAMPRNLGVKTYIEKRRGLFPSGSSNIAVTGKYSLADAPPSDIKYLATYLVSKLFGKGVTGDLKSESIEGYSRTFADFSSNDEVVQAILNKYGADEVLL